MTETSEHSQIEGPNVCVVSRNDPSSVQHETKPNEVNLRVVCCKGRIMALQPGTLHVDSVKIVIIQVMEPRE